MKFNSKPTDADLKEFCAENSFQRMNSGGLDSYDNYCGTDHGDSVVVIGRNRDSDIRAESNFASALESLGGESETVTVERIGHWACGWIELILVDPKDEKAVLESYLIKKALEDYPILDDQDYSQREYDERTETLDSNMGEFESEVLKVLGFDYDETLENRFDLEILVSQIFDEDVGYRGLEEAWVTEDSILRFAESWECDCLAKDGNEYAEFLMTVLNIEPRKV